MIKNIYYNIKNKESILFFGGWSLIAFLSTLGNTSLGLLLLLIYTGYKLWKKEISFFNYHKSTYKITGLFLLWALISSIFAYDKGLALLSLFGYALVLYIIFFGAKKLIIYRSFLEKLLVPLLSTGITISSIYTLYNYFIVGMNRSESLFVRINGTGTLMAFSSIFLIAYFEYNKSIKKYLILIPTILSISALLLTFSRGALLGFLSGFIIYNLKSRKSISILLIILVILFSTIYLIPQLNNRVLSIFSLEKNQNRIFIWESTIDMIKDHPLLGIGPGNFSIVYPEYRSPEAIEKNHPFAHNIFLNMAVELGLVGLIIFSIIIFKIIKMGYYISKINPLLRSLYAGFIAILVHQQFDCTILGIEIAGLFWLIAGLIVAYYYKINPKS